MLEKGQVFLLFFYENDWEPFRRAEPGTQQMFKDFTEMKDVTEGREERGKNAKSKNNF